MTAAAPHSSKQWFDEVIQPTLDILQSLIEGKQKFEDIDFKNFFAAFLVDLEAIQLDTTTVELLVEKILDASDLIKLPWLAKIEPLALIAITGRAERWLYPEYWRLYRPFKKEFPHVKDESLINAYNLKYNIQGLVNYLSTVSRSL